MLTEIKETLPGGKGKICVVGGDRRQLYVASILADEGYEVSCYAVMGSEEEPRTGVRVHACVRDALRGSSSVILPFPLSPDGITLNCTSPEKPRLQDVFAVIAEDCPSDVKVFAGAVRGKSPGIAASFGISLIDYGAIEEIALRNAVPTAEGALEVAMRELEITVRNSRAAVIGYGRCGSELARLLKAVGAHTSAVARSEKARAQMKNDGIAAYGFEDLTEAIGNADIIFNTVPVNVIDCAALSALRVGTAIIELASAPGGVDRECAALYGVKVIHAASLPGKYAPGTAAQIITEALLPLIGERKH